MPRRTELPYLDELLDMFDVAREAGYGKDLSYEDGLTLFKQDLMTDPSKIRQIIFNYQNNFRHGGLVSLGYLL